MHDESKYFTMKPINVGWQTQILAKSDREKKHLVLKKRPMRASFEI